MKLSDLFEFAAPRASLKWPVAKKGTEKRVERSSLPKPVARTSIRTQEKPKDA
jgi:hypothetical protein